MSYPPEPPEPPEQPGQPQDPGYQQQGSQQPYQQPYQQPPYQPQPPMYPPAAAPTSSKATTSLVLGIVSLIACGLLLGIPAMIVARQAKKEIRESQGRVGGDGLATAGFVTGLIGTIWSVLGIILLVGALIVGVSMFEDCSTVVDSDGNTTLEYP